jgi:ferredoxin-NAD(P)+ reductase (naphthalene dioxygenase ferredoxin-specific)
MPVMQVQQWPGPIITGRSTILDAALAAGVPYPHSCRVGECGTCKSRLCSGEAKLEGYAPEALTPAEREAGLILACRATPTTDVKVEWLATDAAAAYGVRRFKAKVISLEAVTHDITRLKLEPAAGFLTFAAGQYAMLTCAQRPGRAYSMANSPDDPVLEFHIRHVPNGRTSSYVAQELKVGEAVRIEGPYGSAHRRESSRQPILLVAGGSGLAPMMAILRRLCARDNYGRSVHLYHGVRDGRDLYCLEELLKLGADESFAFTPVLSLPAAPTAFRTGFVHVAIGQDYPRLAGFQVYTAGPPPMVDAVKATALELGARAEDIYADAFYTRATDDAVKGNGLFRSVTKIFRQR